MFLFHIPYSSPANCLSFFIFSLLSIPSGVPCRSIISFSSIQFFPFSIFLHMLPHVLIIQYSISVYNKPINSPHIRHMKSYCSLRAQQHASPCSYCRNAVLQNTYGMPPYGGVCKLFSLNNRFADRTTHQIKTAGAAFFITAARLSLLCREHKARESALCL